PMSGQPWASDARESRAAGLSFSRDGRSIAASWPDAGRGRVFDLAEDGEVRTLAIRAPEDTALSPDGRAIAVQRGQAVSDRDLASGEQRFAPLTVAYGISGVAWSPDGRWLATVGMAGADLWSSGTGRHVEHIATQTGVDRLTWSPDSRALATGGTDA